MDASDVQSCVLTMRRLGLPLPSSQPTTQDQLLSLLGSSAKVQADAQSPVAHEARLLSAAAHAAALRSQLARMAAACGFSLAQVRAAAEIGAEAGVALLHVPAGSMCCLCLAYQRYTDVISVSPPRDHQGLIEPAKTANFPVCLVYHWHTANAVVYAGLCTTEQYVHCMPQAGGIATVLFSHHRVAC